MFSKALNLKCIAAVLICLLFILPHAAIAEDKSWQVLQDAQSFTKKEWISLLHYKKKYFKGFESSIADPNFFISSDGKQAPQKELQATLKSILTNKKGRDDMLVACQFPARANFIKRELAAANISISLPECSRYEQWKQALNPQKITLVFPSAFMNNPASMFGHTLLRIDTPDQDESTRMLAYSVNFAATTQGEGAVAYAFKGVFGGFYGFFSVAPYYEKLKKYSDLESRDIWEYELNFKADEIDQLIAHLWELREVPFYYYYFDENCSYQLLALLEVARPSLDLTGKFVAHAIPVDTLKVVLSNSDLLNKIIFRPSNITKIKQRIAGVDQSLQELSLKCLYNCNLDNLTPEEQALVLDLSYEYLDYLRLKNKADVTKEENRLLQLLTQRSLLTDVKSGVAETVQEPEHDPSQSHGTFRIASFYGHESKKNNFFDFELRPAYHDLLDRLSGYQGGAGIDFLNIGARVYSDGHLILNKFKLLNVESITERDLFFQPLSWRFETGLRRKHFGLQSKLEHLSTLGIGLSKKIGSVTVATLPELSFAFSRHYNDTADIQPGMRISFVRQAQNGISLHPSIRASFETINSTDFYYSYNFPVNYALAQDLAVRLEFERNYEPNYVGSAVKIGMLYYW